MDRRTAQPKQRWQDTPKTGHAESIYFRFEVVFHEEVKKITIPREADIYTLFTEILFPVLNDEAHRDLLKELDSLLPAVRYTNQIEHIRKKCTEA